MQYPDFDFDVNGWIRRKMERLMSDEDWNQGCALWYWRNGSMDYEIFDHESQAAKEAVAMGEYDHGSPVGLQFSDGRTVLVEGWQALKDAQKKFNESVNHRPAALTRTTRHIKDPFSGVLVTVDNDEPQWLGKAINQSFVRNPV